MKLTVIHQGLVSEMRYEFSEKLVQYPVCGSTKIARILYGLIAMNKELEKLLDSGDIVLGGCIITGDDPVWVCRNCGKEFYKKDTNNDMFITEEKN